MSLSLSSLPPGFSWLRPAYRPTRQEVEAYAQAIARAEGYRSDALDSRFQREAELQLWIWRTENRRRAPRRRESGGFGFGQPVSG